MASRKKDMISEENTVGTTSSFGNGIVGSFPLPSPEDDGARVKFEDSFTLEEELGRLLCTSMRWKTSSFTEQQQAATCGQPIYRFIGGGACGAVYSQDASSCVLKLARTDGRQLWNDYVMHTKVWEALARVPDIAGEVHVPQPSFYVPQNEEGWWSRNVALFPTEDRNVRFPTAALCTERILPLPSQVRAKLIEKFCAPQTQRDALQSPENKDCLVRVYLGSREGRGGGRFFFSLRNFKLHLNQMIELEMKTFKLAEKMAGALAAMHWEAMIDARDVEFVLGSGPTHPLARAATSAELARMEPETYTETMLFLKSSILQHTMHLWVLDFDECQSMSMDEAGVELAADAYMLSDPYYPRPPLGDDGRHDTNLWMGFATRYLCISDRILRDTPDLRSLPRLFIKKVMAKHAEKIKK